MRVERAIPHPSEKALLVPGVISPMHFRLPGRSQNLPDRLFGSLHIPGYLNVRNIESLPRFVEALIKTVLRQRVSQLEPGSGEEIADAVLVLVAVQTPQHRSTLLLGSRMLVRAHRLSDHLC